MGKPRIGIALCVVSLITIFWIASAPAQAQGGGWSEPYRLSSDAGKASEGYLVADRYGFVHVFWTETLFENQREVIKYTRFDGETWSNPNDIRIARTSVNNLSPFIDEQGTLHLIWSEGLSGPVYHTHAPASNAISVQSWAHPDRVNIPARTVRLLIDSQGIFHMLYINSSQEPGVYYVRSEDQGKTWSHPVWIDPDILPNHIPDSLSFELDENDGLHAVWFYGANGRGARPDWVRYAHSLDGGDTWSPPVLIDRYVEEGPHNLTSAGPIMTVQGHTVHVIWAAGDLPYRYHRFSEDAGQTWSEPRRIFGELHGQAGDDFAIDGAGRVHFFSQIRYPFGIYHGYWDGRQWSSPSLIYFIAQEGSEEEIEMGDRVHAHGLTAAVRAGNQLVLTFTDGPADPNRRLFAMHRTLEDVSPLEVIPTPAPAATPSPVPSPTPVQPTQSPTQTAAAQLPAAAAEPVEQVPEPDVAIQMALVPILLLLGSVFAIRLLQKRRFDE